MIKVTSDVKDKGTSEGKYRDVTPVGNAVCWRCPNVRYEYLSSLQSVHPTCIEPYCTWNEEKTIKKMKEDIIDNPVRSSIKDVLIFLETPKEFRTEDKGLKLFKNVKTEIYNKYKDKITEEDAEKLTIATFQVLTDMLKAD